MSFHLKLIMEMDAIAGLGTPLPDLLPLKQCPSVVAYFVIAYYYVCILFFTLGYCWFF